MITKPFPYQLEGIRKIKEFGGRALLGDEQGLGKSLQFLGYAAEEELFPSVVVVPAHLRWNWQNEVRIHLGKKYRCSVLEGRTPTKGMLKKGSQFIFINYDILHNWLEILLEKEPKLIGLDEAQLIKSLTSLRTKTVKKFCKHQDKIIAMSGTPLLNRPSELFPVLNLLRSDIWPNFYKFALAHCNLKKTPWGVSYTGAKRLNVLHQDMLRYCLIRRTKKEVLKDLPAQQRHMVSLPIENRKEYDTAHGGLKNWLQANKGLKVKKITKQEKMWELKRLAGKLKLRATMEWVEAFLEDGEDKLILFAVHKENFLHPIYERFRKISVLVTGDVSGKKRQEAVDRFREDPKIRLFLANIQAGGTGWNGTVASNVAIGELPWTPGEVEQALARIARIGQTKKCFFWFLIAVGTIEEKLCEMLQRKQKTTSAVLDGKRATNSLDIYDQLEELLLKEK